MKNLLILFLSVGVVSSYSLASQTIIFKTIQFNATDGLTVTADLYQIENVNAPYIILFHQAGFSRGEYIEIAPKLNGLGYNCLAVDQRSGKAVNGIQNKTHQEAVKQKLPTKYVNAIPDIIGAYQYVKKDLKANKIIVWGSSYSASLVFYLAQKYPTTINGLLAFSPGEYFKINQKPIKYYAKTVKCPVFITSAKNERKNWQSIYDNVAGPKQFFLPEDSGNHGSKALWEEKDSHQSYWLAVKKFLKSI
jgi:dienelactone hydrolase